MNITIRSEKNSDIKTIETITKAAFKTLNFDELTEHYIVNALRRNNVLTLSLVAEVNNNVVGHIAFSPVEISDGSENWYGAGPFSVEPSKHKKGIGKALMNEGLSRLKSMGAKGCILVGDPNYYKFFGFKSYPELTHQGVPQENVLVLPFNEMDIKGEAKFNEAFLAKE